MRNVPNLFTLPKSKGGWAPRVREKRPAKQWAMIDVMDALAEHGVQDLGARTVAVLVILMGSTDGNGESVVREHIVAEKARMSERQVIRRLDVLVEAGWLRRVSDGRWQVTCRGREGG